eukprot:TRINITY_DN11540_c0_g1_i2.p1 TRINITY_DN11540_c0_g1~~TRINITY_DN11540_c0_g1_i2.p1  ORF type:complete len:418 (-),score=139.87 TRINITY_DN11540_c0_g1_i2:210-1463(-)
MGSLAVMDTDPANSKRSLSPQEMDTMQSTMIQLDTIPTELLLHILQFLEVRYITQVVSRVCTYFNSIAKDEATWKIRIAKRWPGQYPAIPPSHPFDWTMACIAREEETKQWGEASTIPPSITCSNAHYSSVDCIKVMNRLVVSGSRDRGVNIWNVDQVLEGNPKPSLKVPDAHKGWVWSFSSSGHQPGGDMDLVSGSWDNTVKFWRITSSELKETRKPVNLKVAVLATDIHETRVVAGTYDKKVILMDTREDVKKMTFFKCHTKPVLAVKITDRQVISLSEDQYLVVYDRAAGKRFKKILIPGQGFPMSMSWHGNCLYVGDKTGCLYLIDTTKDAFEIVQQYNTGHSGKVTSIATGLGSLITSSSDGDIRFFHPSRNLDLMATIKNPDCGEAAQISYNDHILAGAFSNNTVKIWARA